MHFSPHFRPIGEKRRKALAQAEIIHAVQWSSRDTSLVEFVARLANRIRVMPALFAVLDEVRIPETSPLSR
ncbi:hypothetical protein ANCCAN_08149 [Ancylostoma caninum]|uniref:Uncharacterized protein n=1 Tax=Ancylostoma caninum TaxID=29170 RepID=A0A368GNB0_ANCCA|nr:hypothetical protein ANCCAN_08149 [Ancylostoma caninum]